MLLKDLHLRFVQDLNGDWFALPDFQVREPELLQFADCFLVLGLVSHVGHEEDELVHASDFGAMPLERAGSGVFARSAIKNHCSHKDTQRLGASAARRYLTV